MNTPFKNGYKVTQVFGANPSYYSQFGFKGHEGVDLIPTDSEWNMICIEDGIVIRDTDVPRDAYGNYVLVWNQNKLRGWWYCHMAKNVVSTGQVVKRGDVIGVMGDTGNTQGAHLHLGLRYGDVNKNPVNTDNGYKGFVDPLPVLRELNMEDPIPLLKDKEIDWLDEEGHSHTVGWYVREWYLEKKKALSLADDISDVRKDLDDCRKEKKQISLDLELARKDRDIAKEEKSVLESIVASQKAQIEGLSEENETLIKERGVLQMDMSKLNDEKAELKKQLKRKLCEFPFWERVLSLIRCR